MTIKGGVTSIGSSAFENCRGITEVHITDLSVWCRITFGSSSANPLSNGANLYLNDAPVTELKDLTDIAEIKDYTSSGCKSLTNVTIPENVTPIGSFAFSGCSGITEVHITDLTAWCEITFGSSSANPLSNGAKLYVDETLVTDLKDYVDIMTLSFPFCSLTRGIAERYLSEKTSPECPEALKCATERRKSIIRHLKTAAI